MIETFGNAINYGFEQSKSREAVELELVEQGYYVTYADGTVSTFGNAARYHTTFGNNVEITAMELTAQGYRLLTRDGEVKNVLQNNLQNHSSYYAHAVRPAQVTPTPTPQPTTPYFTIFQNGFTEKVIGRLPPGYDAGSSIITGQASLPGGDTYLITSDAEGNNAREIRHFDSNSFDQANYTGERFLHLRPERGSASIQGLSICTLGLIVTVEENDVVTLHLIQGPFDPVNVERFLQY